METSIPIDFLKETTLFNGLGDKALLRIAPLIKKIAFKNKKYIIRENEISDNIYIVYSGAVSILKKDPLTHHNFKITSLKKGSVIGDISLLDNAPRSASVRAKGETILLSLSISELESLRATALKNYDFTYFTIIENLATNIATRIRTTNEIIAKSLEKELEHTKVRESMGILIVAITTIMVVYLFMMNLLETLYAKTGAGGVVVLVFISIIVVFAIKRMGYPPAFFGITTRNWKIATVEALLATLFLMGLIVVFKWFLMHFLAKGQYHALFEMGDFYDLIYHHPYLAILSILLYFFFVPFQELTIRGALQGPLQDFLISPHKNLWAILMSNIFFSITHIHLSWQIALAIFIGGLVWGWLYTRHRTLIGVSISHAILGFWAFNIVNI